MITRVEVDGFKSFDQFTLDLEPFTVLAGANNGGKSNLLEAIGLLRDLALESDDRALVDKPRGTGSELFRRADDRTQSLEFGIHADYLERTDSVVFLDQVAGAARQTDGSAETRHRTRARRDSRSAERGTYVSPVGLTSHLSAAGAHTESLDAAVFAAAPDFDLLLVHDDRRADRSRTARAGARV